MPSFSDDHTGSVALLVHVVDALPVVEPWLVASGNAPACQAVPVQWVPSALRFRVHVVLFEFSPTPPELSAALPLKNEGTVAARKTLASAGAVTAAVAGTVVSTSTDVVLGAVKVSPALLPAASFIVAPFRTRGDAEAMPFASASPA